MNVWEEPAASLSTMKMSHFYEALVPVHYNTQHYIPEHCNLGTFVNNLNLTLLLSFLKLILVFLLILVTGTNIDFKKSGDVNELLIN
jgi:Trk-type K+ transport system membrane component